MIEGSRPIFVLCYARSGSTLMRYVLDTHPQIVCPPELHLLLAAKQLAWVFEHTAAVPDANEQTLDTTAYAVERVRETVTSIIPVRSFDERTGYLVADSISEVELRATQAELQSLDVVVTPRLVRPQSRSSSPRVSPPLARLLRSKWWRSLGSFT